MFPESALEVIFFVLLNEARVMIPAIRIAATHVNLKKCFIVFFFRVIDFNKRFIKLSNRLFFFGKLKPMLKFR